jgi:hypothetical protein
VLTIVLAVLAGVFLGGVVFPALAGLGVWLLDVAAAWRRRQ